MGALLALVPLKDWVYCGAIVALLTGFGLYTHHERTIGANEALAPVAVIAHKAEIKVAVGTAVAQSTEKDNGSEYLQAVANPPPASVGIVCHRDAGSSDVPQAGAVQPATVGEPAIDSSGGRESRAAGYYDPSGEVIERAIKADAQITYLQGRVKELETQMSNSP